MTANLCPCGSPSPDATLCGGCTRLLEIELGDVPAAVAELETSMARVGAARLGAGSRSAETPIPWDERAANALRDLDATLTGWVRLIRDENTRAPDWPADRASAKAGWLLGQVPWLRLHDAAGEALDEIQERLREARRVTDRAPDRELVGMCPTCQSRLLAKRKAIEVQCQVCGETHVVETVKAETLAATHDYAMHRAELEHALRAFGHNVARETLRRVIHQAGLIPAGSVIVAGHPRHTYRLGDVLDALGRCAVVR